jgi:hypothetical protein
MHVLIVPLVFSESQLNYCILTNWAPPLEPMATSKSHADLLACVGMCVWLTLTYGR